MNSPPVNANAALAKRRREKLIDFPPAYHTPALVQSRIIWKHWKREASRLFAEYWRTADAKHLSALATHLHGMRMHDGRQK